jgi:PilZ domain-containing protein
VNDNRTTERKRTFKGARIHLDAASTMDCLVRSLSKTGASLEIETPVGIPDTFALLIADEVRTRNCRVAWRRLRRIGVKFT